MRYPLLSVLVLAACASAHAQTRSPVGPVQGEHFQTQYIRLGSNDEGLLYSPTPLGEKARIALVFSHPDGNTFNEPLGREMSSRGYRVLMINHHGPVAGSEANAPGVSHGIQYLRSLPGLQRVIIVGHSGGSQLMAFYGNVAEHGPAACQGPQKLYPCDGRALTGLARPDGVVLMDSPLGALHSMSAIDPAVEGSSRQAALDMFTASNGYDVAARRANYPADFARRFYAAQAARNDQIVREALARLQVIEQGKGRFTDDEPFVVAGMGVNAAGARLYQPDPAFAAHTRKPHMLLKADGSTPEVIIASVRPPSGMQFAAALGSLETMTRNTTVRTFLATSAIRVSKDFAITADDIVGVDWNSAVQSPPANVEGITVPALVMVMTCHYLVVPGEIIFDHLGSKDKSFVAVEGAVHTFTPCRSEYGDTVKRTFDYLDSWLSKPGRF
jgi:hypothetical protein